MSHLDAYFTTRATRGLPVYPEPVPGETQIEPGYVYTYEGADVVAIFGIKPHLLRDIVGKRIALKCISESEDPDELHVSVPDGQLIENDDGFLSSNATAGLQADGAYREWVCDPDGNWLLVVRVDPSGGEVEGQIVIQGVPVEINGEPLVNT